MTLTLGLDTFGDVTLGPDGQPLPQDQVLRNLVDQGVLADAVGVDFLGVGEHHRADFAVSAPEVVLAAIAARTARIRLGSAVTVLSSDDPGAGVPALLHPQRDLERPGRGDPRPRVLHRKLPAVRLRPEPVRAAVRGKAGSLHPADPRARGDLEQAKPVPPLKRQRVYPTLAPEGLTTWIGVGGSPDSVIRAVRHDLPMMLAIIGGNPRRFTPYVDLYKRASRRTRPAGARPGRPFARPRRRDRCRGAGPTLAALPQDARPHRRRTRLAARHPRVLPERGGRRTRSTPDRRKPWPARSPPRSRRSA